MNHSCLFSICHIDEITRLLNLLTNALNIYCFEDFFAIQLRVNDLFAMTTFFLTEQLQ